MKKKCNKFQKKVINKKIIIIALSAFMFGLLISGEVVHAVAQLLASSIIYDNSTSGLTSADVQGAIDELNAKADSDGFWIEKYKSWSSTPTNYEFGIPTTSSTTDPSTLNKNVYSGLYSNTQLGVCINKSGEQYCFRINNVIAEEKHMQDVFENVFSDGACYISSQTGNSLSCMSDDFTCTIYNYGAVYCQDRRARIYCQINYDKSGNCYN